MKHSRRSHSVIQEIGIGIGGIAVDEVEGVLFIFLDLLKDKLERGKSLWWGGQAIILRQNGTHKQSLHNDFPREAHRAK